MKSSSAVLASLALSAMLAGGAIAQQSDSATPPPTPAVNQADPAAPTTAMTQPLGTMTKDQLKQQRKQQKRDEAAANATSKAAKARAAVDVATAKSKEANDKQLQAQEKAGQVTPAGTAPATPAPPQ